MKFHALLALSLLSLAIAPLSARADVCDKDSPSKVHIVLMPDGKLAFTEYTALTCNLIGPQTTYSWDELMAKRDEAHAIVDKSGIEDAGNFVKLLGTIAALSEAGEGARIAAATHDGPTFHKDAENAAKVPHAKAVLDALALKKLRATDECVYVDDYDAYKATLVEQLTQINDTRPYVAPVAEAKKSDQSGVKHAPSGSSQGRTVAKAGVTQTK